jgi:hypothetical protein
MTRNFERAQQYLDYLAWLDVMDDNLHCFLTQDAPAVGASDEALPNRIPGHSPVGLTGRCSPRVAWFAGRLVPTRQGGDRVHGAVQQGPAHGGFVRVRDGRAPGERRVAPVVEGKVFGCVFGADPESVAECAVQFDPHSSASVSTR